jgi:hypothetical protein
MTNHSFVVRLWLEAPAGEIYEPKWRGHIIHFPSQLDSYFDDFDHIGSFIKSCLALQRGEDRHEQLPT